MKEKKRAAVLAVMLAVIFVGSVGSYLWIQYADGQESGACYACLYQDGRLIEQIDLSAVEKSYQKTIDASDGGYNIVEVRQGSIGVVDADCPDRLCEKQGFTSRSSKPVVCLPHRFSIEIIYQEEREEELDAVSE